MMLVLRAGFSVGSVGRRLNFLRMILGWNPFDFGDVVGNNLPDMMRTIEIFLGFNGLYQFADFFVGRCGTVVYDFNKALLKSSSLATSGAF